MAAHRVDFINKNDARSLFLGLFKHIAYARGTDTDKHLDKVRAGYRKKGNFCFAGYCLSKQGLSRSRRANHERATRNTTTQPLKLAGVHEKFNELLDFFLSFVHACNIIKRSLDLIFRQQAGFTFAKRQGTASAPNSTLHLPHKKHEDGDNDQDRKACDEQLSPKSFGFGFFPHDLDVVFHQIV